jgi:unsaturated rhamnogalacturonyl hydrolase
MGLSILPFQKKDLLKSIELGYTIQTSGMKKISTLFLVLVLASLGCLSGQKSAVKATDSNTALHTLQPDYPIPYGPPEKKAVTAILDRILNYLDASTPAVLVDSKTNVAYEDNSNLSPYAIFRPGVFRLVSYEWGVVYGAMLSAADATGNIKFLDYTVKRMKLIAKTARYFSETRENNPEATPVRSILDPRALDDAGSMCAAMIKTLEITKDNELRPLIDNYISYISEKQFRLADGTLARNRPLPNTLWLDDLYMSVPALGRMGKLTGDRKYTDDACKQVLQFSRQMFNEEMGLYMHGWVQGMEPHPEFYWARCNGWALMAMAELLDVLPPGNPNRNKIMNQFNAHVNGIARYQSGEGLWHQLLDRKDSYLETSSSAIFTYCIAHGVNNGWLNPQVYGPVAVLGWSGVQTKVNILGQVEGTCVGTGMAFDPAFYYNRPINVAAAHGYGPVILAGSEMLNLLKNFQIVINDSAVMFYLPGTDWSKNK